MATTTTLTPNTSTPASDGGFVVTPAGTNLVTAVNDNSDTTYMRKPNSADTYSIFWNVNTVSSLNETTNIPWRVRVSCRESQGANGLVSLYVRRPSSDSSGGIPGRYTWTTRTARSIQQSGTVSLSGTATTQTIVGNYIDLAPYFTINEGEAPLTQKQQIIDSLQIGFYDASTASSRGILYNISGELQTTTQPTTGFASIDGDTSSPYAVTTSSRPVIEWTYTQADAIPQSAYQIYILNASGIADPTTATTAQTVWSSGTVISSAARSASPTVDLVQSVTIYVYVRTGFTLGGTTYWSTWATSGATSVTFSPPTTPSFTTLSAVTGSQRTTIVATGALFSGGTQTFDVQRSDDGGTTWDYVRDGIGRTPGGTYAVTLYDYEAPRGISAQYRTRAVGLVGSATVTGPWSSPSTITTANDRTHWLKRMLSTSAAANVNTGGLSILADPDFEVEEQTTVLRPLGRTDAVVIAGAIGRDDGAFSLVVPAASWDAVKANLTLQDVLLWQDPYSTQRYIRITRRSWQRLGDKDSPRYAAQVQFVEVGKP